MLHRRYDIPAPRTGTATKWLPPHGNIADMTVVNATSNRLRFRRSGAAATAALLTVVFAVPFAGSVYFELEGWTFALLFPVATLALILPLVIAVWALRSGVDVTAGRLTVKALAGSRSLEWSQIRGFDIEGDKVYAQLDGDTRLELSAVRPADLPQLVEAAGGDLVFAEDDEEPDSPSQAQD